MGDLSEDVERCLCECCCATERAAQAKDACEEGRAREAKRVLLAERQRLLDELHASQRGIDAIDHMLHRVSCECVPRASCCEDASAKEDADAPVAAGRSDATGASPSRPHASLSEAPGVASQGAVEHTGEVDARG